MDQPNRVPLDQESIDYLAEINRELESARANALMAIRTTIHLAIRRNKLQGDWRLSEDGQSLEQHPASPEAQPAFAEAANGRG